MLAMDERAMAPAEESALVGVSGGRDSVALLHALATRGERGLIVCHFDHGLRRESVREAEFVEEVARGYGLRFEGGRRAEKGRSKQSVETAAREARYAFFAEAAVRCGCAHLYLAHHADDQAETFLFNLLRGSGSAGLGAMRAVSQREGLTVHRPLLGVWREEIDDYVAAHALRYCDDPTNRELQHTRNRMRHEILPGLEAALGRKVRATLWRAAEIFAAEDEFLSTLVANPGATIDVAAVGGLPLALQRRLVRAWLRGEGVKEIGFEEIENVLRLTTQRTPAKVNLAAGWYARRREGRIFLEWPEGG
jgi:tRNA(Ile)-lysidine synthetase-like protein